MSAATPRLRRIAASVAVGAGALMLLSACSLFSGHSSPSQSPSASQRGSSASPSSASQSPPPSATPTATATPVALSCSQLLTAQQVYDFNPNYGTDPDYTTASGTPAAAVLAEQGVACGWQDQTSKAIVEVAIAHPTAAELTQLSGEAAETYHVVPTYGAGAGTTGYFLAQNGGTAQVFTKGYWIVVDSKLFQEPGDAQQIVADVVANLP